jgi:hypothetical protein
VNLRQVLDSAAPCLAAITEEQASDRPDPGRWSKKEILGHLIDSAVNNHQRFVRLQFAPHVDLPGYQQEDWVRSQAYQTRPWHDLVQLWAHLNRHLAHVIDAVPPPALSHTIVLDGRPPVTLSFVIEDYMRHLQHHLAQILDRP